MAIADLPIWPVRHWTYSMCVIWLTQRNSRLSIIWFSLKLKYMEPIFLLILSSVSRLISCSSSRLREVYKTLPTNSQPILCSIFSFPCYYWITCYVLLISYNLFWRRGCSPLSFFFVWISLHRVYFGYWFLTIPSFNTGLLAEN